MTKAPQVSDWSAAITERFEIKPTFEAMQRHFYFGLHCSSVLVREDVPGTYMTSVELDGVTYSEGGRSSEESMARTLLAIPELRAVALT